MPYQKITLKNGLRVVFAPQKPIQTVSVRILIKAGSCYESPGQSGIAHLLEHVILKNTKLFPTIKEMNIFLDRYTTSRNGGTGPEEMSIYGSSIATHIAELLLGLSEAIINPLIQSEVIEIEKKRVLEEQINLGNKFQEESFTSIWDDTDPRSRKIYTDPKLKEILKSISLEDVLNYYTKFFTPKNIVIGIAGNYDLESTVTLLNKYFANFEKAYIEPVRPKPKFREYADYIKLIPTNSAGADMYLFFLTGIHWRHPDRFAMTLIEEYMFNGRSSVLQDKLQYQEALCYSLEGYNQLYADTGFFKIRSRVSFLNVSGFLMHCILELRRLIKNGISEENLYFSKEKYKNFALTRSDNLNGIADNIAYQELMLNSVMTPEQVIEEINKVKGLDIQEVAKRYFTKEKMKVIISNQANNNAFLSPVNYQEIVDNAWTVELST